MSSASHSTRRVRVAIVVASLRILGGQAIQGQRILHGFAADPDVDAWLVPINPEPPSPFRGLIKLKYIRTVVTQLLYWPLLFQQLRRADVVHVFSASYFSFLLAPLPAVLVGRLLGKRILLNYHSGEAPDHLARSPLARFVLRRLVHLNVVPSTFLRDVLAAFEIPAIVIANTVDTERFGFRHRQPIAPRLISTRSLEPMYNVACTLKAFAIVQRSYPDATLTVVGGGSQDASLRQLAAGLGLRNVHFTGPVAPDSMPRCYDAADIYVQSPHIDNMPLSVLEAFASGLPVVATRIGGVPSILTDGQHGYLAGDDDERELAAHVLSVLTDQDEARRRATAARVTCQQYEWPAVRDQWAAAYRALAAAPRITASRPMEARL